MAAMDEQMPSDAHVQKNRSPRTPHFALGARGETLAIQHLEQRGYRIVAANFSLPIGRNTRDAIVNAEIDVVAYDGATLCFIEVKTRTSHAVKPAEAAVDQHKKRELSGVAREFLRHLPPDCPYRFDVVSVYYEQQSHPTFELFRNAFGMS